MPLPLTQMERQEWSFYSEAGGCGDHCFCPIPMEPPQYFDVMASQKALRHIEKSQLVTPGS